MTSLTCPHCNANLDGGSILESFLALKKAGDSYWKTKTEKQIKRIVKSEYPASGRWGRSIVFKTATGGALRRCPDCEGIFN